MIEPADGRVRVRIKIGHTRPWARYVRRRCLGAWFTWICLTIRLLVSRPFVSAFASAFFRRPRRNSADFLGQRAFETPNCFPVGWTPSAFDQFKSSRCVEKATP